MAKGNRAPVWGAVPARLLTGVLGTKALAVVETVAAKARATNPFFILVNIIISPFDNVCVCIRKSVTSTRKKGHQSVSELDL